MKKINLRNAGSFAICLLLAGGMQYAVSGQVSAPEKPSAAAPTSPPHAVDIDRIYSDMMQSLPGDLKERLDMQADRTSGAAVPDVKGKAPVVTPQSAPDPSTKNMVNLDALSPEVRAQVEAAIRDMQRTGEFKKDVEFKGSANPENGK